jgi:hypothetical protein
VSSVNVECHKIDLVVFEIERIFPNSAVQNIAVYTGNDESFWQLSLKHIVLNVIHVTGGYHVRFHFYPSEGVFTADIFQCFQVTHSNGGAQLYLSHTQNYFLNLDFIIGRVCTEGKSVPTSCQINFQIHVVE